MPKGKTVCLQSKEVNKVFNYFSDMAKHCTGNLNRTLEATGTWVLWCCNLVEYYVCVGIVKQPITRFWREASYDGPEFSSTEKWYELSRQCVGRYFNCEAIKRGMFQLCEVKQNVTLLKLLVTKLRVTVVKPWNIVEFIIQVILWDDSLLFWEKDITMMNFEENGVQVMQWIGICAPSLNCHMHISIIKIQKSIGVSDGLRNSDDESDASGFVKIDTVSHTFKQRWKLKWSMECRLYVYLLSMICLSEKEGMLVKNECSSWYSRGSDFLVINFGWEKQLLYTYESACMTWQINPTPPECMDNGTECYDGWVWMIYLFIHAYSFLLLLCFTFLFIQKSIACNHSRLYCIGSACRGNTSKRWWLLL